MFSASSCRVKITFTFLLTNRFISTTTNSMKCLVNWIPLRIYVRSKNNQPHLKDSKHCLQTRRFFLTDAMDKVLNSICCNVFYAIYFGVFQILLAESSIISPNNLLNVCCSVLQSVAECCSVLQCSVVLKCAVVCFSALQCIAVFCSVLQCSAVFCSVLQCSAVSCSMLQYPRLYCTREIYCIYMWRVSFVSCLQYTAPFVLLFFVYDYLFLSL